MASSKGEIRGACGPSQSPESLSARFKWGDTQGQALMFLGSWPAL